MDKPCEYCGHDLPAGIDKWTRRMRSAHFASCQVRLKRVEEQQADDKRISAAMTAAVDEKTTWQPAEEVIATITALRADLERLRDRVDTLTARPGMHLRCFGSAPGPVERAENACNDCPVRKRCDEVSAQNKTTHTLRLDFTQGEGWALLERDGITKTHLLGGGTITLSADGSTRFESSEKVQVGRPDVEALDEAICVLEADADFLVRQEAANGLRAMRWKIT